MSNLYERARGFIFRFLPLPWYYGREFRQIRSFLESSRHWSREQMQSYKLSKLRELVRFAGKHAPYYRELFKSEDIDYRDLKSLEDFAGIPPLTKDILFDRQEDLKADDFERHRPISTKTSGTTGRVTHLYRSQYQEAFRNAVVWRIYNNWGIGFRDRIAQITNPTAYSLDSPLFEIDRLENRLVVNSYHIIHEQITEIMHELIRFKPKMIWTHPSILGMLAEHAQIENFAPLEIPVVATYAAKAFENVKRIINKSFPTTFKEYYGNRENTISAWGDSDATFYEVSEYCHLEVDTKAEAQSGEIVSTSLHNYAMPMIRYCPGDIGRNLGFEDEDSPYPKIELIGGRGKNLLMGTEGIISPAYFYMYLEKINFNGLLKYQMVQEELDRVVIKIVPKINYIPETDEPILLEAAKKTISENIHFRIEYVSDIPFTKSGKFRQVISPFVEPHLNRD